MDEIASLSKLLIQDTHIHGFRKGYGGVCTPSMVYATGTMVQRSQKRHYACLSRSTRQVRPVLGTIFFLIAANLVAKGVVGLNAYNPIINGHGVQGSLYLQFGQNEHGHGHGHGHGPYQSTNVILKPMHNDLLYPSTEKPYQPIHQQQIINIHDLPYENAQVSYQDVPDTPQKQIKKGTQVTGMMSKESIRHLANTFSYIKRSATRVRRDTDSSKKENGLKFFQNLLNTKVMHNITNANDEQQSVITEASDEITYPDNIDFFDKNITGRNENDDIEIVTIARQIQTTTVVPTTTATPTTSTSTRAPPTTREPATTTSANMPGVNNQTSNTTGHNDTTNGYGPYSGNENVAITTMLSTNLSANATNTTSPGYYYYPAENYGPSNGNENISITYGPPVVNRPFFSSPEDQFLNNQQLYNNDGNDNSFHFYELQNDHVHKQIPDISKYNDIVHQFYNMYDYHYPAFYNNYIGK